MQLGTPQLLLDYAISFGLWCSEIRCDAQRSHAEKQVMPTASCCCCIWTDDVITSPAKFCHQAIQEMYIEQAETNLFSHSDVNISNV